MPYGRSARWCRPLSPNYRHHLHRVESDRMSLLLVQIVARKGPRLEANEFPPSSANMMQCSGALPCANCKAKLCQCIYDPSSDRRRKSYSIESSALRQALLYTVVKLRSRARDEVKTFISKIRSLQTDRDGENFLLRESSHAIDNSR